MKNCIIHPGLIGTPQDWLLELNIEKFPTNTDMFVHTWDYGHNLDDLRTFLTLYEKRYNIHVLTEKYTGDFADFIKKVTANIDIDEGVAVKKFAVFFSMYRCINLIPDLKKYQFLVKVQCNLSTAQIYIHHITEEKYPEFEPNRVNAYPMLESTTYDKCVYGLLSYRSFSQRLYYFTPHVADRLYKIPLTDYQEKIRRLYIQLVRATGDVDFEGNLLWMELFKSSNIPVLNAGGIQIGAPVEDVPYITLS